MTAHVSTALYMWPWRFKYGSRPQSRLRQFLPPSFARPARRPGMDKIWAAVAAVLLLVVAYFGYKWWAARKARREVLARGDCQPILSRSGGKIFTHMCPEGLVPPAGFPATAPVVCFTTQAVDATSVGLQVMNQSRDNWGTLTLYTSMGKVNIYSTIANQYFSSVSMLYVTAGASDEASSVYA